MSTQPNVELKLPAELLNSIFALVSPEALVVSMRCSKGFFEICNPLLYREVHLHTPIQLTTLSDSQKAMQMLKTTRALAVDDFVLYLEAWDGANVEDSRPLHYLLRLLYATSALRSLKITRSHVPTGFSRRSDWEPNRTNDSKLLHTANDPEFLPKLTLISVFNSDQLVQSCWFETLCYDRVIECYSTWNDGDLHVKIFPALESYDTTEPSAHLSPLLTSQLASYPKQHISSKGIGRFIQQSLDFAHRSKVRRLGLLLQFPGVTLNDQPSPIHDTFSWLKNIISTAECHRLEGVHVKFKPLPLDWEASLDTQRLGLEDIQKLAPGLVSVGLSSTALFWKRWMPVPDSTSSYSTIPDWTPCPVVHPGTRIDVRALLLWWLNALGLDVQDVQDRERMKDSAKRMSAAMCERWNSAAPSEDTLNDRFLKHVL